jgi:hypothetical protein
MRRVLVLFVAALAACSSGGGREEQSSTNEAGAVDAVVPAEGDVLAGVEGVGEILAGFAIFETDDPEMSAADAGPPPDIAGVLDVGPGLAGEAGSPFVGALQVRLNVPEPPTSDAIPVAIHRDADGRVSVEPALWDPAASQMVVWATTFSDRWGAWFDPRNWIEEVVQVGQGTFDFVADFVTGRTDPPACRNNPPGWSSASAHEASSLHVCAQSNPTGDGAERFEVYLKSNRRTAQIVTIPSVSKDFVWVENMPDEWRRMFTSLAGVDPNTNTGLLGTQAMSLGFRRPEQTIEFDLMAYQTPRVIAANPVFALLGNLPIQGTLGAIAAVAKCHAEASGIDITRLDPIPDSDPPDVAFLEGIVRCAFETLQHPELAFGAVQEIASAIGMSNAAVLDKIHVGLQSLAPTVARIASGLAIGSTLTNLWDGIFDNLADGRVTISLTGNATPSSSTSAVVVDVTRGTALGFAPGAPAQQVLDAAVSRLGTPTRDAGWQSSECPLTDRLRVVLWDRVAFYFLGASSTGYSSDGESDEFIGAHYRSPDVCQRSSRSPRRRPVGCPRARP